MSKVCSLVRLVFLCVCVFVVVVQDVQLMSASVEEHICMCLLCKFNSVENVVFLNHRFSISGSILVFLGWVLWV